MSAKTTPIPKGYHAVTPYLIINGAIKAIEFYKQAFGAVEILRIAAGPDKLGHAELKIGDSHVMLADEFPEFMAQSPKHYGGSPVSILLYVPDCDSVTSRAVAAGAKLIRPVKDQFYGDRSGTITDPFGHQWTIATHIEDLSIEELNRRAAAQHGGG